DHRGGDRGQSGGRADCSQAGADGEGDGVRPGDGVGVEEGLPQRAGAAVVGVDHLGAEMADNDPGLKAVAAVVGTQVQRVSDSRQVRRVGRTARIDGNLSDGGAVVLPQLGAVVDGEVQEATYRCEVSGVGAGVGAASAGDIDFGEGA